MTEQELQTLHETLAQARSLVDSAPERFESTTRGCLAEADYDVLMAAGRVTHRLMLWQKYPQQSPESYLKQDYAVGMTNETQSP